MRHITHCHCSLCRKAHGAAFATYATVARKRVRVTEGEALLGKYRSTEHAIRRFCVRCGSQLFFEPDEHPDAIAIALGTVDGDPVGRPEAHIHVSGKAVWYAIEDSLPRYEEDPPA